MRRNLIDGLLLLLAVGIVLLAFTLLSHVRAADQEAEVVSEMPLTPPASSEPVLSIPPTQTPEPLQTPGPSSEPTLYNPAIPLSEDLQIALRDACEEYGVDVAVALGVIEVESGFDQNSDNGLCYGLMQLNRRYFPSNLPAGENIRYGLEYLGQLLTRYSTVEAALTSYNAGHDTGSQVYANAVLAAAEKWKEII